MLREKVAEILFENGVSNRGHITRQILNLFKAEVDKLTVINLNDPHYTHQLQHTKKQLLDLMESESNNPDIKVKE